jgi:hypothetical protein
MIFRNALIFSLVLFFISTISYGETVYSTPLGMNVLVLQMTVDSSGNALGTIDLSNSSFKFGQVRYCNASGPAIVGDAQNLQQWLNNGFADGTWSGKGIISGTAATDPDGIMGINWCTGQQYLDFTGKSTFHNVGFLPTDILGSYGYYGDCNFDGMVNTSDYDILLNTITASSFGQTTIDDFNTAYGTDYQALGTILGDLNYDGIADDIDLSMMENLLSIGGKPNGYWHPAYTFNVVPEPSTIILLCMGGITMLICARRRGK